MRDEFYRKLDLDKININRNSNPVEMELFMSFLTVDVSKIEKHLGSDTGWTKYSNEEIKLTIGGGWLNGVEYLDSLNYSKDLHNPYNNYVTPFNIFEFLTEKGRYFFLEYYKCEIKAIINDVESEIETAKYKIKIAKERKIRILNEIEVLSEKATE